MTAPQFIPTVNATQEEWLPVVGYEGRYEVSSLGRVRSLLLYRGQVGRILVPGRSHYPNVNLTKDGVHTSWMVHLLVARAFLGPVPAGMEVHHKDHDKANAVLGNLLYTTRSANLRFAVAAGQHRQGERCSWSRLTAEMVREIRRSSESQSALAGRFGVSRRAIGMARRGDTWRGVA